MCVCVWGVSYPISMYRGGSTDKSAAGCELLSNLLETAKGKGGGGKEGAWNGSSLGS